jgi:hypothetical protein
LTIRQPGKNRSLSIESMVGKGVSSLMKTVLVLLISDIETSVHPSLELSRVHPSAVYEARDQRQQERNPTMIHDTKYINSPFASLPTNRSTLPLGKASV